MQKQVLRTACERYAFAYVQLLYTWLVEDIDVVLRNRRSSRLLVLPAAEQEAHNMQRSPGSYFINNCFSQPFPHVWQVYGTRCTTKRVTNPSSHNVLVDRCSLNYHWSQFIGHSTGYRLVPTRIGSPISTKTGERLVPTRMGSHILTKTGQRLVPTRMGSPILTKTGQRLVPTMMGYPILTKTGQRLVPTMTGYPILTKTGQRLAPTMTGQPIFDMFMLKLIGIKNSVRPKISAMELLLSLHLASSLPKHLNTNPWWMRICKCLGQDKHIVIIIVFVLLSS